MNHDQKQHHLNTWATEMQAAAPDIYKPIEVKQVVVVRNGTERGKPTVDFVLEGETGQKFVFMVTGALLKSIPC